MNATDRQRVQDILDNARSSIQFTTAGQQAFLQDAKTQYAVARAIEIMGEASKNVSAAVTGPNAAIPWSGMAKMRDKLIHDYSHVDAGTVWRTVSQDIPALVPRLQAILAAPQVAAAPQGPVPQAGTR